MILIDRAGYRRRLRYVEYRDDLTPAEVAR